MILELLSPRTQTVIGLDIGVTEMRMVELSGSAQEMRLDRYAVEPVPEGVFRDGELVDTDALVQSIRACQKKLGSRNRVYAAAVAATAVSTKTFELARSLPAHRHEAEVAQQIAPHISIPIDEVSIDFELDERASPADGDYISGLAVATHRKHVDARVAAVSTAGGHLHLVEPDSFSMIRAAQSFMQRIGLRYSERNVLICDMGELNTQLHFIRDEAVIYTREHPVGSDHLVNNLMAVLGMDAKGVHQVLYRSEHRNELPQQTVAIIDEEVAAFGAMVGAEIGRAIEVFGISTEASTVDAVLLMGRGAAISGLAQKVASASPQPTYQFNPFHTLLRSNSINPQALAADATSLVIAFGLAMRRFDK